ncbi:MAG: hypothetical protein LBB21_07070 [Holosporaceae bacterium]|nr:hypothetical protein [Holosporaceae bacterium]
MLHYFTDFIEFMFGAGVFFNAVLFIPQVAKIYKTKSVRGLSLTTFLGFNVMQVFAILHWYIKSDFVLMFEVALSFVFCGAVTVLIFLYKDANKFR